MIVHGPADDVPLLDGKTLVDGKAAVYVCERFTCQAPVTDPRDLDSRSPSGYGRCARPRRKEGSVSIQRRFLVSLGAGVIFALLFVSGAVTGPARYPNESVTPKAVEFKFKVSKAALKKGIVAFKVTNGGDLPHDLKVCSSNQGHLAANTCTGRSTPS